MSSASGRDEQGGDRFTWLDFIPPSGSAVDFASATVSSATCSRDEQLETVTLAGITTEGDSIRLQLRIHPGSDVAASTCRA